MGIGLDVGTNMLVSASTSEDGDSIFKQQRDAFYRIVPKTEVNKQSIKTSLDKRSANYIVDKDGSFIVVGQDALDIAIERNDVAQRPMSRGVVSPREKAALPMLKLLIESLIGTGDGSETCTFSVPGEPVDDSFDVMYHREMMSLYISQLGYKAKPINEAFAVAMSELLDEDMTGIAISWGAGMTNVCVVFAGDSLIEFSLTKGGDFIDTSVGKALDVSPSLVQMEKESGTNLVNPSTKIMEAVSVYYSSLMSYVFRNIAHELNLRQKTLPLFKKPASVVFSGGLTLADGFIDKASSIISEIEFPFTVGEIKLATQPTMAVANGALLSSIIYGGN